MKGIRVLDTMLPPDGNLPLHPHVQPDDLLSRAIELMILYDLQRIAVLSADQPIGMVNRKDALQKIGLRPKCSRDFVDEQDT